MKINLEKELLRQNKKVTTSEDLLLLREFDRLGSEVAESETLSRIGINSVVKEGKELKEKVDRFKDQTKPFNQRVFHISQIEALCKKYYLRFLPSKLYKGSIDAQLAAKISQVEIAYGIKCREKNCFIVAPASSFKLEVRPKDPLLFYSINEEYFYLIHKWGNDLNLFRRILPLFTMKRWCILSVLLTGLVLGGPWVFLGKSDGWITPGVMIWVISAITSFVMCLDDETAFLEKDCWRSEIKYDSGRG